MEKLFYRVQHPNNLGLWYDNNTKQFTHKIKELDLKCADLEMGFNQDCAGGFLSCTDSLDNLYDWFSREELLKLADNGYDINIYKSNNYKFHDKYKHFLFQQEGSLLIAKINLV